MNEDLVKEVQIVTEKEVINNKLRKINSAREKNHGRKIVLFTKNKKIFPADFFNKNECEKRTKTELSVESAKNNSNLSNISDKNIEFLKNIENSKKFIKMLSEKRVDVYTEKTKQLNVILEEDEEKIRNSTKNEFFKEKIDIFNMKEIKNYSKSKANKQSLGWDNSVFFPPVIDISHNSINQENSASKDKVIESSVDMLHNNSNSKNHRNHNNSSNETSINSYNLKQKISHTKSLKVNINLDDDIKTPKKSILYTPKDEHKINNAKAFFTENISYDKYNSGGKTTKNEQRRSIKNVSIINEKFMTENSRNRPNSVLFNSKPKHSNRKLNFEEVKKDNSKNDCKSNHIIHNNHSRNDKPVNLPVIDNAKKIDKDLHKILQACAEFKEDPIINSKLTNILQNIDEIKHVMKTKSARAIPTTKEKLSDPAIKIIGKEENKIFSFSKLSDSEQHKIKAFETQKEKKFTKSNTNYVKLPVKLNMKDNKNAYKF